MTKGPGADEASSPTGHCRAPDGGEVANLKAKGEGPDELRDELQRRVSPDGRIRRPDSQGRKGCKGRIRVGRRAAEIPDHRHRRLLRARRQRPYHRTSEERHELAPVHSITSSARASNVGGTSSPSPLAVLRLITSSYLVGC